MGQFGFFLEAEMMHQGRYQSDSDGFGVNPKCYRCGIKGVQELEARSGREDRHVLKIGGVEALLQRNAACRALSRSKK
jgi:hypothetical protein